VTHACEHHKVVGDRAKYGLVTPVAPQQYTRQTRPGLVAGGEGRAVSRREMQEEQTTTPRWQSIRVSVSYASVGTNREHHCYAEGDVTKVRRRGGLTATPSPLHPPEWVTTWPRLPPPLRCL
jgi:hypothetical protein